MAWSAPRTWVTGEVLTAANMNTYVRDELLYLNAALPIGGIMMHGGSSAPTDWQICDGSAASTPALVAVVGANVPDLRGKFVLGVSPSHARGSTGGAETVTLTVNQMPNHGHTFTGQTFLNAGAGGYVASATGQTGAGGPTGQWSYSNEGGGAAHENMPPFYSLIYIIRCGPS